MYFLRKSSKGVVPFSKGPLLAFIIHWYSFWETQCIYIYVYIHLVYIYIYYHDHPQVCFEQKTIVMNRER